MNRRVHFFIVQNRASAGERVAARDGGGRSGSFYFLAHKHGHTAAANDIKIVFMAIQCGLYVSTTSAATVYGVNCERMSARQFNELVRYWVSSMGDAHPPS